MVVLSGLLRAHVAVGACCHGSVRWWRLSKMLPRHASTSQTEPVTDPSPAQTGTGTSRRKIFAPVPVPQDPIPVTHHRVPYPCPSLFSCALIAPHDSNTLQLLLTLSTRVYSSYSIHYYCTISFNSAVTLMTLTIRCIHITHTNDRSEVMEVRGQKECENGIFENWELVVSRITRVNSSTQGGLELWEVAIARSDQSTWETEQMAMSPIASRGQTVMKLYTIDRERCALFGVPSRVIEQA